MLHFIRHESYARTKGGKCQAHTEAATCTETAVHTKAAVHAETAAHTQAAAHTEPLAAFVSTLYVLTRFVPSRLYNARTADFVLHGQIWGKKWTQSGAQKEQILQ